MSSSESVETLDLVKTGDIMENGKHGIEILDSVKTNKYTKERSKPLYEQKQNKACKSCFCCIHKSWSLDFTDAYFHIPISHNSQKY